jgi:hypothetical protein
MQLSIQTSSILHSKATNSEKVTGISKVRPHLEKCNLVVSHFLQPSNKQAHWPRVTQDQCWLSYETIPLRTYSEVHLSAKAHVVAVLSYNWTMILDDREAGYNDFHEFRFNMSALSLTCPYFIVHFKHSDKIFGYLDLHKSVCSANPWINMIHVRWFLSLISRAYSMVFRFIVMLFL